MKSRKIVYAYAVIVNFLLLTLFWFNGWTVRELAFYSTGFVLGSIFIAIVMFSALNEIKKKAKETEVALKNELYEIFRELKEEIKKTLEAL